MDSNKVRFWGYWVSTALVSFATAFGGFADLTRAPQVLEGMRHLGYPDYFATVLGTWKVLGVLALLAPGLPRLKEWAYAGLFFDFTGASISHAASGDDLGKVITPLVLTAVLLASWALRPATRAWPLKAANVARTGSTEWTAAT